MPNLGTFGVITPYLDRYESMYGRTLADSERQYADVLSGYQNILGQQQAGQAGVAGQYPALSNAVLGTIAGIGASKAQDIQDVYAKQSGAATQNLISKGLGNTTVQSAVQRGLTLDAQKAQIALANQIAGLTAQYQSSIGLAGLGYQGQALAQNAQLGANMYGAASRVNFPQPQAGIYGQAMGLASGGMGGGYGGGGPRISGWDRPWGAPNMNNPNNFLSAYNPHPSRQGYMGALASLGGRSGSYPNGGVTAYGPNPWPVGVEGQDWDRLGTLGIGGGAYDEADAAELYGASGIGEAYGALASMGGGQGDTSGAGGDSGNGYGGWGEADYSSIGGDFGGGVYGTDIDAVGSAPVSDSWVYDYADRWQEDYGWPASGYGTDSWGGGGGDWGNYGDW